MSANPSKSCPCNNLWENFQISDPWKAIAEDSSQLHDFLESLESPILEEFQDLTPLLLSTATGVLLSGLWCGNYLQNTFETIGKTSEELFRGEQLPFLKFPRKGD